MTSRPEDIARQTQEAADAFRQRFGRAPTVAAVAPGRVNLIGEHTDYNDGFVLPMAIQRQTVVVADHAGGKAGSSKSVRVATTNVDGADLAEFTADETLKPGEPRWANYVKGVVAAFLREGVAVGGFDAVVHSTVPVGGGLSSSAAIEVATATALESLTGKTFDPQKKALMCQWAEHNFPRVPCGIMDQTISARAEAGHAMLLDCRSLETRMVPLDDPGVSVLIANTNVEHELSGGEYAERRAACEAVATALGVGALRDVTMKQLVEAREKLEPLAYRRAYHVVGEIARTLQAVEAAGQRDWQTFGRLMYKSHASLRDDFEVSCVELDTMVDLAKSIGDRGGVFGSRMTGGGFGGCTVSLVRTRDVSPIAARLFDGYRRRTKIDPTIFATAPAAGARLLKL